MSYRCVIAAEHVRDNEPEDVDYQYRSAYAADESEEFKDWLK